MSFDPCVGVSECRMEFPNTRARNKCTKVTKGGQTRNPRKSVFSSKVVNHFTCALAPPFTGRRKDFYILRLPSNIENIRGVNAYMNVFYIQWLTGLISYIHKSATNSNFKPKLSRWRLWLGLPLTLEASFMKIITCHNSRTETPQDSRNLQVPDVLNFATLQSSWSRQQTCELKLIRL
jgi:hypothetical protein